MDNSIALTMDEFGTSIKKKYRERRINKQRQWPPSRGDTLVELELVEEDMVQGYKGNQLRDRNSDTTIKRTPLACQELFKGGGKRPIRKVLLEGEAGIGKTTLCTSISEEWADEGIFQQFEAILLLPLRHKNVASATSLSDLLSLLHPSQPVRESVVHCLEKKEGEGVLIIADGWDELSESQRKEGSFLYEVLFGERLPFVSVLLTSRPSASSALHELQCIDRFVEVCGFSKKGIQEYVHAEFANDKAKAKRLLQQLENNPLVESVCSIPLNCAIICHLWRTLEGVLPSTMTELYSKIILNLVFRNALKRSASEDQGIKSLCNFNSLPKALQDPWQYLCHLAFQAVSRNQVVFTEEELANLSQPGSTLNDTILSFGLLQAGESVFDVGKGVSFHFLHQTFQEFLAALHLTKQSSTEQLTFCQQHGKSDHISMLWRFFFGISFQALKSQAVSVKLQKALFRELIYSQKLTICHCAIESKDESVTNLVAELLNAGELRLINPRNVSDCSAVINVIVNTHRSNKIVIDLSNCNLSDMQVLVLSDALVRKQEKLQVKELNLSGNKLTDTGINLLFQRSPAIFSTLESLNLSSNNIGAKGLRTVMTTLASASSSGVSCLTEIVLWHNPIGTDGFQVFEDAIRANTLTNLNMLHLDGSLTNDADINGSIIITFAETILAHCHKLQYISLSENNLSVPGAHAIGAVLSQLAQQISGFGITLNETMLGDEGIVAFLQSLQGVCPLSMLDLKSNNIHSLGASSLAESITSGRLELTMDIDGFCELSLDENPLGVEGALAIGKILSNSRSQLSQISLSQCELAIVLQPTSSDTYSTDDISVLRSTSHQLLQLQPNSTIDKLFLDGNSFLGEGVYILAGLIRLCPHVKLLFSTKCGISTADLKLLLDCLVELNTSSAVDILGALDTWYLGENYIDDDGACSLVEHQLLLLKSAQCIDVMDNPDVSPQLGNRLHGDKPSTTMSNVMIIDQLLPVGNFVSTEMKKKLEDSDENECESFVEDEEVLYQWEEAEDECEFEALWEVVVACLYQDAMEYLYQASDSAITLQVVETSGAMEASSGAVAASTNDEVEAGFERLTIEQSMATSSQLELKDRVLDFGHGGVSRHLGQIADTLSEWEGPIAEGLGLTPADVAAIKVKHPYQLHLQTRAALEKWKQKLGSDATYSNLISVFEHAGYQGYAEVVRYVCGATNQPLCVATEQECTFVVETLSTTTASGESSCDKSHDLNKSDDEIYTTPPTTPLLDHNSVPAPTSQQILPPSLPQPELKDLVLIELVNWHDVGLQLGVKEYDLKKIECDYPCHDDRKREMFSTWLKSVNNPNYHDLIEALEKVGERKAAQQLWNMFS